MAQFQLDMKFPLPGSWYIPHMVTTHSNGQWAYLSMQTIVLVTPTPILDDNGRQWPKFKFLGFSSAASGTKENRDKFLSISFTSQKVPEDDDGSGFIVPHSSLVSSSENGIVKLWNLKAGIDVRFHTAHKGFKTITQWSPLEHHLIYSMDTNGNLTVWDIRTNTLRLMSFGKFWIITMSVSRVEKDILAIGSSLGQIHVILATGRGTILNKMKHGNDTINNLLWTVDGFLISSPSGNSKNAPVIRFWNKRGIDLGLLKPWRTKEEKAKSNTTIKYHIPIEVFGNTLYTVGPDGEILSYNISDRLEKDPPRTVVHDLHRNNNIFALLITGNGDTLWSLSYEPIIIGWNLQGLKLPAYIPTFRGITCIEGNPFERSWIAVGGNDEVIRVLKATTNFPFGPSSAGIISNNPVLSVSTHLNKSKVSSLAWHPDAEATLAFGTDDGVLGVANIYKNTQFTLPKRIKGTVYSMQWGPVIKVPELQGKGDESGSGKPNWKVLYLAGAGCAFVVDPYAPELCNLSDLMFKRNNKSVELTKQKVSEFKWAPDYSCICIGYHDGEIELYEPQTLKRFCSIKTHQKSIQLLTWRESDFGSISSEKWLASSSNDGTAKLFNLSHLFTQEFQAQIQEADFKIVEIIQSTATLTGHGGTARVISHAWSPHQDDHFLTVGTDKVAILWNFKTSTIKAKYGSHTSRLVSCIFHPTDPFKILTGSDQAFLDPSFHIWDWRNHEHEGGKETSNVTGGESEMLGPSIEARLHTVNSNGYQPKKSQHSAIDAKHDPKKKRTPLRQSSILPICGNGLVNFKLELCTELLKLIEGTSKVDRNLLGTTKDPEKFDQLIGSNCEFYLKALEGIESVKELIDFEIHGHKLRGNWDLVTYLSKWIGSNTYLEEEIESSNITETMIATIFDSSPNLQFFFPRRNQLIEKYCQQLLATEPTDIYKVCHYYLIIGKTAEALDLLKSKNLYREALVFATVQSFPTEVITKIKLNWAEEAVRNGNYELAVRIYVSLGSYSNALKAIVQRKQPYAWKAGILLASVSEEFLIGESMGLKYLSCLLEKREFEECYLLVNEYSFLKWLTPVIKIYEELERIKLSSEYPVEEFRSKVSSTLGAVEDLESVKYSIKTKLLVSIPQCGSDALLILSKNICLLECGIEAKDHEIIKTDSLKLLEESHFFSTVESKLTEPSSSPISSFKDKLLSIFSSF